MNFLELKDIAEVDIELINPTTPEKILTIGRVAGMAPGKTLIDYGCGYAEPLLLWAESFGISGVGIDIRQQAVGRARQKIAGRGLSERLQIVHGPGADYECQPGSFDFAACVGASFVWDGYRQALQAMRQVIRPQGRVIIGEPYWLVENVSPDLAQAWTEMIHSEAWLLHTAREEGFDVQYVIHSSHEDWDRYEAGNWDGLLRWIEANPNHPERQQVIDHLHESQEEYFTVGRLYFGWALYLLNPVKY
jgi:SAM-dependent methyltransferase